jgi:NAD(P)-dependent dehydrogenase (short-subunit alcohol dehydrogenase family)
MTDLNGKVALVTGGSAGIGAAIGHALAAAGARVLLADIDEEGLERTTGDIGAEHAAAITTDVSDPAAMQAAVDEAVGRWGGLDIAILNAGLEGVVAPILDYPLERFDQVMAVNLRGVFLGVKSAAPAIAARGGGAIIIMSSVAGMQGTPGFSAYTASKHAVVGLMRCAALELAPQGIRVNSVNPGPIETRMMRSLEDGMAPGAGQTAHDALAAAIPLKRYGTPEEVARLTLFLASDDGAYCTGGTYLVDGGMTAGRAVTA